MRRIIWTAVAIIAISVLIPSAAHAATWLDQAVAGLKPTRVFVAPGTEGTDQNTAGRLETLLSDDDHLAIVMLPEAALAETGEDIDAFAKKIDDATKHRYIVAVAVGNQYGTSTTLLPTGVAFDRMNRAKSVGTNSVTVLDTFIRDMHKWQAAHPGEVKEPTAPPEPLPGKPASQDDGISWTGIAGAALLCFILALVVIGLVRRSRRQEMQGYETVKLDAPAPIRDELRDLLDNRHRINDTALQQTITQLVKDTKVVFEKLGHNQPNDVDTTVVEFEAYLRNILEVINVYVDIQNRPRYYDDPEGSMQDGRDAINGFADFVLTSARRAGRKNLTKFNVNTKILSARRYA
jgi:hypothetical protein